MELIDTYRKSPLTVRHDYQSNYKDIVIKNSIIREHPIHMHDCTELLFVLKGKVEVKVSFETYTVSAGAFVVINCYDLHKVKALEENSAISCIHLSENLFSPSEGFIVWWLESLQNSEKGTSELTDDILELIRKHRNNVSEKELLECAAHMMKIFRAEFKLEAFNISKQKNQFDKNEPDMTRLNEIYLFFYTNYNKKVTLEEMAEHFAMSKYYLSHYVKKGSGFNFQKIFNMIRCDRAEIALLEGHDTIESIRRQCGFSSNQYFNSSFKKMFGLIPSEYRKKFRYETLVYKNFLEEEIEDVLEFLGDRETKIEETGLTIRLAEGDYRVTVVNDCGEKSGVESFELQNKRNLRMELDQDESILIIKRQ